MFLIVEDGATGSVLFFSEFVFYLSLPRAQNCFGGEGYGKGSMEII